MTGSTLNATDLSAFRHRLIRLADQFQSTKDHTTLYAISTDIISTMTELQAWIGYSGAFTSNDEACFTQNQD